MRQADLDNIEDALSEEEIEALVDYRGGCDCKGYMCTCPICSSPLTMDEAIALDFLSEYEFDITVEKIDTEEPESEEIKTDRMNVTRNFCR